MVLFLPFACCPSLSFFSALVSVLYYLGIMQLFIRIIGGGLQRLLGTTQAESLSAAANIFVGQTEAPLVVKPYIAGMTRSELFAVMCGGMASIAGTVMGGFAAMGVKMEFLLAASFMAAPGGLLFAKLLLPETQAPDKNAKVVLSSGQDKPANVFDAAAQGASTGLSLPLNVGAMLIAFISLIAVFNALLSNIGELFGIKAISIELLLSYLFYPVAWLFGLSGEETWYAASLIGQKLVLNEFVAYVSFTELMANSDFSARAEGGDHLCLVWICQYFCCGSLTRRRRHPGARAA